jgi:hypothetical protein
MNTTTELEVPIAAGSPLAGGIYAGRFFIGGQAYALIVAPADLGELASTKWGHPKTVPSALSYVDGLANTRAMAKAGSTLAQWAQALRIADHDDWYIPSRLEALLMFGELEPGMLAREWYWTSTQYASYDDSAWFQDFDSGNQSLNLKDYELRARAVRRLAL